MIKQELRTSDFKIGCFHGKLNPVKLESEAQLRNEVYLTGNLKIVVSKNESIYIRLLAYELPLEKEKPRGRCIDLLGYDAKWKPYIIELKDGDSTMTIEDTIKEVMGYAKDFESIRKHIENEVKEKFFYPDFNFSNGVGKVILAPRSFYKDKKIPVYDDQFNVYICSFGGLQYEGHTPPILEKCGSKGYVSLKVEKK